MDADHNRPGQDTPEHDGSEQDGAAALADLLTSRLRMAVTGADNDDDARAKLAKWRRQAGKKATSAAGKFAVRVESMIDGLERFGDEFGERIGDVSDRIDASIDEIAERLADAYEAEKARRDAGAEPTGPARPASDGGLEHAVAGVAVGDKVYVIGTLRTDAPVHPEDLTVTITVNGRDVIAHVRIDDVASAVSADGTTAMESDATGARAYVSGTVTAVDEGTITVELFSHSDQYEATVAFADALVAPYRDPELVAGALVTAAGSARGSRWMYLPDETHPDKPFVVMGGAGTGARCSRSALPPKIVSDYSIDDL